MTDHEKLLIALLADDDRGGGGEVSMFDVMTMLYALGEEYRRSVPRELVLTTA